MELLTKCLHKSNRVVEKLISQYKTGPGPSPVTARAICMVANDLCFISREKLDKERDFLCECVFMINERAKFTPAWFMDKLMSSIASVLISLKNEIKGEVLTETHNYDVQEIERHLKELDKLFDQLIDQLIKAEQIRNEEFKNALH